MTVARKRNRDLLAVLALLTAIAVFFGYHSTKPPESAQRQKPVPPPTRQPVPPATEIPTPVYSIAGIRPGMTLSQVEAVHGPSRREYDNYRTVGSPPVACLLIASDGRVECVTGRWLQRDSVLLVEPPLTEAKLKRTLGPPSHRWTNGSWCGTCYAELWAYPGGLSVTSDLGGLGMFRLTTAEATIPEGWVSVGQKRPRGVSNGEGGLTSLPALASRGPAKD